MDIGETDLEKQVSSLKRHFLPSLAVSALAVAISNTIVTLLLLEIASTFQIQAGIAAQIRTANAAAEMVFAILMSFLATRYKHKSLLILGILLVGFSAVGTFLSTTLSMMLVFSFMEGAGTVVVTIMVLTIIGDSLPLTKKNKAAVWVTIAGFISTLIGTPTINFIAGASSWRYAFLLLVLPVSMAGFLLVSSGVKSTKSPSKMPRPDIGAYLRPFKLILSNKSATAYLASSLFFTSNGNAIFSIAFLRLKFSFPLENIVYMILFGASLFILGSLFTGKFVNRLGAKRIAVAGAFGSGVFIVLLFLSPNVWIALAFNFLQAFLTSMAMSAYSCLALDQVPNYRSAMMSLTRIFVNSGYTLAPAIGGTLLVLYSAQSLDMGYALVGLTFGLMNIIAALILILFTKDTTKVRKSLRALEIVTDSSPYL
jgi:predicted MFS family arabinose efflux permease